MVLIKKLVLGGTLWNGKFWPLNTIGKQKTQLTFLLLKNLLSKTKLTTKCFGMCICCNKNEFLLC